MPEPSACDQIVFDSGSVQLGAFRCDPGHPSFHDSGPIRNWCFVFPRTAVEIQHEFERAFVANPRVVTFYNQGQAYWRNAISLEGDRCDWFGVELEIVQDVVRGFDPGLDSRPERPFRFTRGWSDAQSYLMQRRVFDRLASGSPMEALAVEEIAITLLERVVRLAYGDSVPRRAQVQCVDQREVVHRVERVLSARWGQDLTLRDIAREVGMSVYHLCRMFRRATGTTLHQYRQELRLRWSLEDVIESRRPLVDIALDAGFSSHSHFTSSFRRQFAQTPSQVRVQGRQRTG
jgi:AraC-like DNA-binding protein